MKKWKRILSTALSVLLLSGNISVCAAESPSAERTYTDRSEVIGTAVVVGDEDSAGESSLFSRPGTIVLFGKLNAAFSVRLKRVFRST